jgi:cysteine dioxygenase
MTLSPRDNLIWHCKQLVDAAEPFILEQMLKFSRVHRDDFKELINFEEEFYTRNTVITGKWFEMLIMCWKPGQRSLIHNHGGCSCAVKVLDGVITETHYHGADKDGFVQKTYSLVHPLGSTIATKDTSIHMLENDSKRQCITLHIYSPPLDMNMEVFYCEDDRE